MFIIYLYIYNIHSHKGFKIILLYLYVQYLLSANNK